MFLLHIFDEEIKSHLRPKVRALIRLNDNSVEGYFWVTLCIKLSLSTTRTHARTHTHIHTHTLSHTNYCWFTAQNKSKRRTAHTAIW